MSKLTDIFFRRSQAVASPKAPAQRSYAGAGSGLLTSSWITSSTSADQEIRNSLTKLRNRSRDLHRNNDYVKRFNRLVVQNVIGPQGISLQVKSVSANGKLDTAANALIESSFKAWGKKGVCDVTGRYSWRDLQRLVVSTCERDGEVLVRKVNGWKKNRFRFALQVLECDRLDETLNVDQLGRPHIRMGVELDEWGAPVAYHLFKQHPGDGHHYFMPGTTHDRIPADELLHLYLPDERPHQTRGVPWLHSAILRLQMLDGYEEAEVVAARTAAAKMGFFEQTDDTEYKGDAIGSDGNPITDAQAGHFEVLAKGLQFKGWDPTHPSANFGPFVKAILRGIASGLGVSYNSLANDLEGVNYSSLRAGALEERDSWMTIQDWLTDALCEPVYQAWLDMALLSGAVNLPVDRYDKYNAAHWQPRRWAWVDPLKDLTAKKLAIDNHLTSHSRVVSEAGGDFEDLVTTIEKDQQMLKKIKGVPDNANQK